MHLKTSKDVHYELLHTQLTRPITLLRVPTFRPIRRAINLRLNPLDTSTRVQVRATRALNTDILDVDIRADGRT